MKYYAKINKRVRNIKVYRVVKRVNDNTNSISKKFARLIDKYIVKNKEGLHNYNCHSAYIGDFFIRPFIVCAFTAKGPKHQ
jgi:hypothetical protein